VSVARNENTSRFELNLGFLFAGHLQVAGHVGEPVTPLGTIKVKDRQSLVNPENVIIFWEPLEPDNPKTFPLLTGIVQVAVIPLTVLVIPLYFS
jgi:hypothetical protein